MAMNRISVSIITFNEEDRIKDAIKSVKEIADEIVVVDSHSTDSTCRIAEDLGAKVFYKTFEDYGSQKNFGIEKTSCEWVLNIDADERLSDELIKSIKDFKESSPVHNGYYINRRTAYLGRWIKQCGWYPDRKLRLFRKSESRWEGRIHERLELKGSTGRLKGDLLHHTYRNISDHINRLNRYTQFQAEDLAKKNKKMLWGRLLIMPKITFIRYYFWKLGILEGFPGFLISLIASWATAMKYMKALEIKRKS